MTFVPTIVTTVPTDPEVGKNDVMLGGSAAAAGTARPTTTTVATRETPGQATADLWSTSAHNTPLSEVRLVSCAFCTPRGGASATAKWTK